MRKDTRKLYNEAMQEGIPILLGTIQDNQIWVWCPFCRRFHFHGVGDNRGEGFKGPHCTERTSLFKGFKKNYLVLNIESFKNKQGELEDPSYDYDKNLDHISGHQEMMKKKYKQEEVF